MTTRAPLPPLQASDFTSAFPRSSKVYVEEHGVRVPMREISLSNGDALRARLDEIYRGKILSEALDAGETNPVSADSASRKTAPPPTTPR